MSTRTQANNFQCQTTGHDLVSYQCQHRHKRVNFQCQTNGHDLFNYQCQHRHEQVNNQCQTNGHDFFNCQCQHRHKRVNFQCQTNWQVINVKPDRILSTCSLKQGTNYSITIMKVEYIPTNMNLEIYVTG